MQFSEKIKALRNQKGLTQVEFGKLIGFPQATIASWESGARTPKPITQEFILRKVEEND